MKSHIVIKSEYTTVEDMFSSVINTPKDLRNRIVKRFPGRYRVYFHKDSDTHGTVYIDGDKYNWTMVNSTYKSKKPSLKIGHDLIRNNNFHSYMPCTNDIVEFPKLEDAVIIKQPIHSGSYIYLISAKINGVSSWIKDVFFRCAVFNADTLFERVKSLAGKRIQITKAYRNSSYRIFPTSTGILTGRPISYAIVCDGKPYDYKFEEL